MNDHYAFDPSLFAKYRSFSKEQPVLVPAIDTAPAVYDIVHLLYASGHHFS